METKRTSSDKREMPFERLLPVWLEVNRPQVKFPPEVLADIDRSIGFVRGDAVVCETTCLEYAVHALENGASSLTLVPASLSVAKPTREMLDELWKMLSESSGDLLESLARHGNAFGGLVDSVPDGPFRMLATAQYMMGWTEPEPPLQNRHWAEMLDSEGSTGMVVILPPGGLGGEAPRIGVDFVGAVVDPGRLDSVTEYHDGLIAFATRATAPEEYDSPEFDQYNERYRVPLTISFLLRDLSDPRDSYSVEASRPILAVNDGCITPSVVRNGVEVVEQTTLGALASRIGRGTTLSEKDLDVTGRLSDRIDRERCPAEVSAILDASDLSPARTFTQPENSWWEAITLTVARDDDLYYVDGSCFQAGAIFPIVLGSIPKGQERYVVESHDGEVLLVTRNGKEPVVYRATKPTLIGNGVFVIRLASDIDRNYVTCWMRGAYARKWLGNGGKFLTKALLERLPVPILSEEDMRKTVQRERVIDKMIRDLRSQINKLASSDRFSPLAAKEGTEVR